MNLFAFIDLLASALILFFALLIYQRNPHERLYRHFSAGLILIFGANIGIFFMEIASSIPEARLIAKVTDSLWTFAAALFVHSMLIFSDSPLLTRKKLIPLLYLPAAICSLLYLTTDLTYLAFINTPHGVTYITSPYYLFFMLVPSLYLLGCLLISIRIFLSARDQLKRSQAILLGISFILPFAFGVVIEAVAGFFRFDIPLTYPLACAFSILFISIATYRYRLFPKYPEIAAESIFRFFPDILLVTDMDNKLNLINSNFIKFMNLEKGKDIRSVPLSQVIDQETADYLVTKVLKEKKSIFDYPLKIGGRILSVNATQVKDPTSDPIGMVIIGRDVTEKKLSEDELKKTTDELSKHLQEIDRINKLFIERELEMVNLKEEIARINGEKSD